jgi:hypothetical protein
LTDEPAWWACAPEDSWLFDKLILARRLGYTCGPVGVDVPTPGRYIVRPCVNALGMGRQAKMQHIERDTDHLPVGYFWCEVFDGPHVSVDYTDGEPVSAMRGSRLPSAPLYRWQRWDTCEPRPMPDCLREWTQRYRFVNVEYIGGKPIELHLRHNPDARHGSTIIPVWRDIPTPAPPGMRYVADPDYRRLGFYVST